MLLDKIERFKAPHNPHEIVGRMCAILWRYRCTRCYGDDYAAEWTRTAFHRHAIDYERSSTSVWNEGLRARVKIAKPKSVLYAELLPRLNSGGK